MSAVHVQVDGENMNPSVSTYIEMCNEIRNENTIYVQAPAAHTMKTMLDQVSKYRQVVELSNFENVSAVWGPVILSLSMQNM